LECVLVDQLDRVMKDHAVCEYQSQAMEENS
jgi:hypothetical protein